MPTSTATADVARNRLLTTNAPSRETGANKPPCFKLGARHAKSERPPPIKSVKIPKIKTPRAGSLAKECTDVITPERTRKVPNSESENVKMDRRIVHTFNASRFSITMVE